MSSNVTSKQVASNLIWRSLERVGAQGITLIVSIVLARLLLPEVYGVVALVTVIISILEVLATAGLGTAIVQKKEIDILDYSSVFWFNLACSLGIYILLFFLSPVISVFYNYEGLTLIMRVMGIAVVVYGIKNVQHAYVSRNMEFRKFFFSTLFGTLSSGIVGIIMAYRGCGVWAIVVQNLMNHIVDCLFLNVSLKLKINFSFSLARIKTLFQYGWKLLVSSIVDKVYVELNSLVIAKKYTSNDLAYYNKGNQFPSLIANTINSTLDSVLLSVMSKFQDEKEEVKRVTKRSIKTGSFLIMPSMAGLIACAPALVPFLLTENWIEAVPFLQVLCLAYVFYSIHSANLNAFKAVGRSDLFLWLEIVKKIVGIITLLICMRFGVFWIAISIVINSILSLLINTIPSKRLINYSLLEQIIDILPSLSASIVMGTAVYFINYLGFNYAVTLLIQIPAGIGIYIFISYIFSYFDAI